MNPSSRHPIGVPSQLFRGPPAAVAATCRRLGLGCVRLAPNFPGLTFREPGDFTPQRCRAVARPFLDAGVAVACLSGPVNLMEPDLARRQRGLLWLHALLRHARDFGTPYVVTESGSLSPFSPWEPCPANRSAAAWAEFRLIVSLAVEVAAEHGATLLLEADPAHVLATAADAARLADTLTDPHLGFVMDPAVMLMTSRPEELAGDMGRLFERLGAMAPVACAKDLAFDGDGVSLPRAGTGALDYGLFLRLLDRYQPAAPIILGHLCPDEVQAARAYVEGFIDPV
jgi:sugar phosphate isomerase/epimerase